MKALKGKLTSNSAKFTGEVYYGGDSIKSGKFLVSKVADYIEQNDTHTAVLTVEETLKFAWLATTGGHHSYARAVSKEAAAILDKEDHVISLVRKYL